jgi:hypothetical protein
MYTQNDLAIVQAYNAQSPMYQVSKGRVQWYLRNMHKQFLNEKLSKPVVYAQDLAVLKRQVRQLLTAQGLV